MPFKWNFEIPVLKNGLLASILSFCVHTILKYGNKIQLCGRKYMMILKSALSS